MILFFIMLSWQTGVDAGPAQVSCEGSVVTLQATPIDPPANYRIDWEDGAEPGVFLVVNPSLTTVYRVFLTDLDTSQVFEDVATVFVHPTSADLVPDNMFDQLDWNALFAAWGEPPTGPEYDPDGDLLVTILDWFYFCNFDVSPPNTPPRLFVDDQVTYQNESRTIPFIIQDDEQQPILFISSSPAHGTSFLLNGQLWYDPDPGYIGPDSIEVRVTDGFLTTPPHAIQIQVLTPDVWADLYNDIFFVYCKACHIEAVSAGLSLSTYALAQQGGASGAGFIPSSPESSPIYLRVADGTMPQGMDPLTPQEVERIRLWILRGAAP